MASWWRHQMEAFSALLALCAGNSPVTGEFPTQRPVTRNFDVFFDWLIKRTKAICQLHKILLRFKGITLSAAFDLFDKLITPILCYGCEVWGFHSAPDIERVHLSFCKRIMCVKKSSQNAFVYGLLGRFPLELNRQCRIMSYWLKIVTGYKPIYVSQRYQASLSRLDNIASQNWAR